MKKLIALLLAFAMVFCLSACTKKEEEPVVKPEPEDPTANLSLTLDEWPVIDGATAMLPYYEEMAARILGISVEEASKHVLCNTTTQAYPNLYEKTVDMIFCAPPSAEQVEAAKANGVEYESVQVLNSGFVFFVNKSNPVNNLSSQQIHDIYAGKITNWKEVGGNDEKIIAYQRSEGSGSQTGLYQHVISKDEVAQPPIDQKIGAMAEIIDAVANYDNASGAIGYSYYYYVTNMHYQEDVKLIAVDNVYPSEETISYDIYPYISKTCAIFRSDEKEDSVVRKIAAWCAGSAGRKMSVELGYVPSGDSQLIVPGYAKYKTHDDCTYYQKNNLIVDKEAVTAENGFGYSYEKASYFVLSGLKDEKVQQSINDAIKAVYDKYTDVSYIPEGRSLEGLEDKSGGNLNFIAYQAFNGNNIFSMFFSYNYSKQTEGNYYYCSKYIPLTFDLNTGKQLALGDLFNDKDNGFSYLNSAIYDMINDNNLYEETYEDYSETIRLVKPFDGLRDDQKFYIEESGYIYLVIDEDTPEFYPEYSNSTVMSFCAINVIDFEKYLGKNSIFTDDTKHYYFTTGEFKSDRIEDDFEDGLNEMIGDKSIYITHFVDLSEDLSPAQIKAGSFDKDEMKAVLRKVIEVYDEEIAKGGKYVYGNVYCNSYATKIGEYTEITKYFNAAVEISGDNDYRSELIASDENIYVYPKGSDTPMKTEDIFAEGVDYKAALKAAMYASLEKSDTWVDLNNGLVDALIDAAIENNEGFYLNPKTLNLHCPKLMNIFNELFAGFSNAEFYDYSSCINYIDYSCFNSEDLTIFR